MTQPHISFDGPVLLAGGAPLEAELVHALRADCRGIAAADGGADGLDALGIVPDVIIGDLDSLEDPAAWEARGVPLRRSDDQDTTDFQKCLEVIDAPGILATGFTGARIDHTLAVCSTLAAHRAGHVIVAGGPDIMLRCPQHIHLDVAPGTRVSLFPITPFRGTSTGLHWALDAVELAPDALVGTSNRATGPVTINVTSGCALLILPRDCLPIARRALGW